MAAEVLAKGGARVTVYDRMPSVGRKFLLAGRGGLNLTHSEPLGNFMPRYGGAQAHLRAAIEAFPPDAVRAWCVERLADYKQPSRITVVTHAAPPDRDPSAAAA